MAACDSIEQLLLTVRTCFVYKLPPLKSATAGQQAGNWDLANPILTAELRVYQQNNVGFIRLYEKKGIQTRLFAQCRMDLASGKPIQAWMEPVTDSSRYFVLRCEDEATGRKASVGFGFGQREESFSFKATIQDFEGSYQRQIELERRQTAMAARRQLHTEETSRGDASGVTVETAPARVEEVDLLNDPTLDFSLGANQTIKVKTNFAGHMEAKPRRNPASSGGGSFALAPPPVAGSRYAPQAKSASSGGNLAQKFDGLSLGGGSSSSGSGNGQQTAPTQSPRRVLVPTAQPLQAGARTGNGDFDLLGMDFGGSASAPAQSGGGEDDDWGDFIEG